MFKFRILARSEKSKARVGEFLTPHGKITTPAFMSVGTVGAVKGISPWELKDLGAQIILSNTYHLYLRPGHKIIKKMGGLHKFMGWDGPILTDSGGFQVFSLGAGKSFRFGEREVTKAKVTDGGVTFYSHIDGSKHFFSPEKAMEIQKDLGADIIMSFDECPAGQASRTEVERAVKRTHQWLKDCTTYYQKKGSKKQALFGIVQGGIFSDLRKQSAEFVAQQNLAGNAIGGVAVGEPLKKSWPMVELVNNILPNSKPRYLMGVGEPQDLQKAVSLGCDMFDCVLPTRLARHGVVWVKVKGEGFGAKYNKLDFRKSSFRQDSKTLDKNCGCPTCTHGFSRGYLHHLIKEKEMLGARLLTLHNLWSTLKLMGDLRTQIQNGL